MLGCPKKAEPSSSGALKRQSRRRRADWAGWAGTQAGRCGGSKEGAGSLVVRIWCSHPWDLGVILGQRTKIEQKKKFLILVTVVTLVMSPVKPMDVDAPLERPKSQQATLLQFCIPEGLFVGGK